MSFFQRHDTFFKLVFVFVFVLVVINLALIDRVLLFAGNKDGAALPAQILSKVGCDAECQRIIDQKVADAALRLPSGSVQDTCGKECEEKIDEKVSDAIAKLPTPKAGTTTAKSNGTTKTSFVSVGTSFSTTNTAWTDIKGGEAWIDPADYGSSGSPTFTWETSLRIANANGEAWARLYDTTNNIAVSGSEVKVTSSDYSTVESGNLPLWAGRNLYRVQIKSTTSQSASFTSGRVKVVYK